MTDQECRALTDSVERQIAALLSDLEARTGRHVEGLTLESLEVTNIESDAPRFLQSVRVELRRLPGSEWRT